MTKAAMLRDDEILTHPVFNRYHSETETGRRNCLAVSETFLLR